MRRKAATIRDIAQKAGVGVSTVSYVLNGNDQHVSPATRDLILSTARDLNYRPNAIARSMVKRKTATIGLIISELQNPLFMPVTEGVEEILRGEGYQILLASAENVESEIEVIETLRAQQVEGLIVMSLSLQYPDAHLRRLVQEDVPLVVINRDLRTLEINRVQFDDLGAGRQATQHLIDLGHKMISTISGPMNTEPFRQRRSAMNRLQGWQEAMSAAGLPAPEEWVFVGGYTYEGGYRACDQFIEYRRGSLERPTALFVASDTMAVGALKRLHEAGIGIPQEVAVITIGDAPFSAYTYPALTTLALPVVEAGRLAAQLLIGWLKDGAPQTVTCATLRFDLKIRESCGAILQNR